MEMTNEQKEALSWARSTGLLVRWSDGAWRGRGAGLADDSHDHEDIAVLVGAGLLELTPAGAVPIEPINLPFERVPVCACDSGFGPPPSREKRVLCDELDLGPCSEGYYARHPQGTEPKE